MLPTLLHFLIVAASAFPFFMRGNNWIVARVERLGDEDRDNVSLRAGIAALLSLQWIIAILVVIGISWALWHAFHCARVSKSAFDVSSSRCATPLSLKRSSLL